MIKDYIKEFDTNSEYQSYIAGDPVLPNVSYIVETNEVEYKPYVPPMNIIIYGASEKLVETTSNNSNGLHTNAFITTIKSHTFENGVGTIEFNDDVTYIGNYAFFNCSSLTSITIPSGVTSIDNSAFSQCTGLTSITIPSGVTSIGNYAFYGCSKLTSVTIPDSVTSIGSRAFSDCNGLTSIVVDSANNVFDSRNNSNAIIKTSTNELIAGCKNTVIPNTVTSIGTYAFEGCTGLTNVTIGSGVTSIGEQAFSYCNGLTSITIPDSVTSIGDSAFSGCRGLTSVTSLATTAPTIQSTTFKNVKPGGTLTVPSGSTGYNVWMGNLDNWTKVEQ